MSINKYWAVAWYPAGMHSPDLGAAGITLCLRCRRKLAAASGLPLPLSTGKRGKPRVSADPVAARALRAAGASLQAIADEFQVSRSTAARLLVR